MDESTSTDETVIRNRSGSTPQRKISGCPEGLCFLSIINRRRRYFLPSTKNYFGGMKVSKLLCDGGCSSILLPIESVRELSNIFKNHEKDCLFQIKKGISPGGSTVSLVLKQRSPYKFFDVSLCSDILSNSIITVKMLRYSLSTEDIRWILSEPGINISPQELIVLGSETKVHGRRSHGLLGQHILDRFTCIKHNGCELYVDTSKYQLPSNFQNLDNEVAALTKGVRTW